MFVICVQIIFKFIQTNKWFSFFFVSFSLQVDDDDDDDNCDINIQDTYSLLEIGLDIDTDDFVVNQNANQNMDLSLMYNPSDVRPWSCAACDKTFLKRCYLRWHLRNECGRPPTFVCKICNYSTYIKSHFKRHLAKGSCGRLKRNNVY